MKLGYIYTVTSGGYDDGKVRINDGGWSSVVEDERQLWLKYSVNGELVALTMVEDGIVMAITRIIGGVRADNNITTWVHIPSKIKISGLQLKAILQAVKELNKSGTKKITPESFVNHEILYADFDEKHYPIKCNHSYGNEMAVRYPTIDYSLTEILGLPYQEYYSKYKYIFLINNECDNKEGLKDLSNVDLQESICILPPSLTSIQEHFGSPAVSIKFSDGKSFDAPVMVKKGQVLDLIAEKADCIPMHLKGQAVKDEEEVEISVYSQQWKRIITQNYFQIIDLKTGERILPKPRVDILDSHYDTRENSLPEELMHRVAVKVSANGYEPFNEEIDLTKGTKIIALSKIIEKETYTCQNSYGEELKVTISGPGAKSLYPIKGYKAIGQKLEYSVNYPYSGSHYPSGSSEKKGNQKREFAWAEFAYGIIAAIAIALICWSGIKLYDMIFIHDIQVNHINDITENITQQNGSQKENCAPIATTEQAIAYLDNSEGTWQRDSLIKYPELDGLFEELNSYQFNKILNRDSKLRESKNFKKICDAISINLGKPFNGNFCGEGDYSITVSNYEKKLNKPVDQPKASANGGVASEAAKKAQKSSSNTPASQKTPVNNPTKEQKPNRGGV